MRDAAKYDLEMLTVLAENFAPKMRRAFTEAVSHKTEINRDILQDTIHGLIEFTIGVMDTHVGVRTDFSIEDLTARLTAAYVNVIQDTDVQRYIEQTLPPMSTLDKKKRLEDVRFLDNFSAISLEKFRQKLLLDNVPPRVVQQEVDKLRTAMVIRRGNLLATSETTRAINAAVMQMAWANISNNFDPKVEWVARKDRKTEKECQALDGEVISMGDTFFLLNGRPIEHPPAHPGCRCFLSILWTP